MVAFAPIPKVKKKKKMNHADLSREGEKKWERGGKIRKEGA